VAGCGVAWGAILGDAGTPRGEPGRPVVLDATFVPFLEDDPIERPRILADIGIQLERRKENEAALVLEISAVGPRVEPERGWEGVRGANRKTAQELRALLASDELVLWTMDLGSGETSSCLPFSVRRGRIPLRRAFPDGRIGWNDRTGPEAPLEVRFEVAGLAPGTYRSEVVARGRARFRVGLAWDGREGEIRVAEVGDAEASAVRGVLP